MLRQKIELIEQELGRWRTGEAVPPSEQTALGEEVPLCDQVRQAANISGSAVNDQSVKFYNHGEGLY